MRGSAQNLPDGSVVVFAAGDIAALDELTHWLRQGPPLARVDTLESEPVDPAEFAWPAGFVQK